MVAQRRGLSPEEMLEDLTQRRDQYIAALRSLGGDGRGADARELKESVAELDEAIGERLREAV